VRISPYCPVGLGRIGGKCRNLVRGERGTMVRRSVPLVVSM
jgi:hypothetical protein